MRISFKVSVGLCQWKDIAYRLSAAKSGKTMLVDEYAMSGILRSARCSSETSGYPLIKLHFIDYNFRP